jgi:hypothetical protein
MKWAASSKLQCHKSFFVLLVLGQLLSKTVLHASELATGIHEQLARDAMMVLQDAKEIWPSVTDASALARTFLEPKSHKKHVNKDSKRDDRKKSSTEVGRAKGSEQPRTKTNVRSHASLTTLQQSHQKVSDEANNGESRGQKAGHKVSDAKKGGHQAGTTFSKANNGMGNTHAAHKQHKLQHRQTDQASKKAGARRHAGRKTLASGTGDQQETQSPGTGDQQQTQSQEPAGTGGTDINGYYKANDDRDDGLHPAFTAFSNPFMQADNITGFYAPFADAEGNDISGRDAAGQTRHRNRNGHEQNTR